MELLPIGQNCKRTSHRHARVHCPVCERSVERQSRQQIYCSAKCMRKANYARKAGLGQLLGQDTALVPNPTKFSREINDLQRAKSTSSARIIGPRRVIQAAVVDTREWTEVVSTSGVVSYVSRITQRALVNGGAAEP